MSVATDSPGNSWSIDDFAALIDAELDSALSDFSPDVGGDDDIDVEADDYRAKRRKVEVQEETEVSTSCPPHSATFGDLCVCCGERIDNVGGVPLGYIHKGLMLPTDEMSRQRTDDFRTTLSQKKLYLVIDLDHTVLNSTRLEDLSSEEDHLHSRISSLQDISNGSLFRLDKMRMMTKLRPFVRSFLQEASSMFQMYIYTMGERAYAVEMAKLLDPEGSYFNSRVISQEDCTQRHQKGLDIVLGPESAVLILDDTEAVWPKHKDNLIVMERYHFFASSCRQFQHQYKSLSQLNKDENELDGALATVLGVLKRIHGQFYDPGEEDDFAARDVRQVRRKVRKEILKDCNIVFSRVIPNGMVAHEHPLWKLAEQLGATCSTKLEESVTHVVAPDSGTDKSRWAVKEGKFLVHPRWVEASGYLWKRQPEENFRAASTKKSK